LEKIDKKKIFIPEYIQSANEICDIIVKDQNAETVKKVREPMMKLIINGIPLPLIFSLILRNLMNRNFLETFKRRMIFYTAFYEKRSAIGSKSILHLEAYICRVMFFIAKSKSADKVLSKNK
jgi:hypothetical protein